MDGITSNIRSGSSHAVARCHVELANYFAAAVLMPYDDFHEMAEKSKYDIDRMASAFAVSFEQACQRLTTMQRETKRGVPFFFLRVDKAGNVTKRFNATSFNIAEHGDHALYGTCIQPFGHPALFYLNMSNYPMERNFYLSKNN